MAYSRAILRMERWSLERITKMVNLMVCGKSIVRMERWNIEWISKMANC